MTTDTSSGSNSSSNGKEMDWSHLYRGAEKQFDEPITLEATVVHGFKRGSKELGVPTANLSMEELGESAERLETGIYYGFTYLKENRYPTVVSIGWNPFYKNTKKTIEAHLLAALDDFYDEKIKVILYGYLRQETNFNSLEELISCINSDITETKTKLACISAASPGNSKL